MINTIFPLQIQHTGDGMKIIYETLKDNLLFAGIEFGDFEKIMACLSAKVTRYEKDDIILLAGGRVSAVGLVLSGSVKIIKEDIDGRIMLLNELGATEIFGEVFACAGVDSSPVTVQAAEDAEVLFIGYRKIIAMCSAVCPFHTKMVENMLKLIAQKSLHLSQRIDILSKRSTREKLLAFLDAQSGGAKSFQIPFNREELAHYLCVDRSAMSAELSKMRADGLIRYQKNLFEMP